MTDSDFAETRCIALSESDREGSVEVNDNPLPTRTKVRTVKIVFYKEIIDAPRQPWSVFYFTGVSMDLLLSAATEYSKLLGKIYQYMLGTGTIVQMELTCMCRLHFYRIK